MAKLVVVFEAATQCKNMKCKSKAYNNCKMERNRKIITLKVTSVHDMRFFFSLQRNDRNSIEIGLFGQFLTTVFLNIVIFH